MVRSLLKVLVVFLFLFLDLGLKAGVVLAGTGALFGLAWLLGEDFKTKVFLVVNAVLVPCAWGFWEGCDLFELRRLYRWLFGEEW
jgi:hypothetical protein